MVISEIRANFKILALSARGCPDRGGSTVEAYSISQVESIYLSQVKTIEFDLTLSIEQKCL